MNSTSSTEPSTSTNATVGAQAAPVATTKAKASKATNGTKKAATAPATARAKKAAKSAKAPKAAAKKAISKAAAPAKRAAKATPPREFSKKAIVLDLLKRKSGATLAEIIAATDWQKHSVRGFISGTLGKRMGLTVESTRSESGERTYRLTGK